MYNFLPLVSTVMERATSVYIFSEWTAPLGVTLITRALWLWRNHKQEPQLPDLDFAFLQWKGFNLITSNAAKWISLTIHLFSRLLHLAGSIIAEMFGDHIYSAVEKWNGNAFCPGSGWKYWDLHRRDVRADRHRKTETERQRRGQDEHLDYIYLCLFITNS